VIVITCYETAFILLAITVKRIAVGVVYALWSGVGVALVTSVAWLWLGQPLDAAGLAGVGLIVAGVVVINSWSKTTAA
jgi:multidrug transporter EmrE-like cation transporter